MAFFVKHRVWLEVYHEFINRRKVALTKRSREAWDWSSCFRPGEREKKGRNLRS